MGLENFEPYKEKNEPYKKKNASAFEGLSKTDILALNQKDLRLEKIDFHTYFPREWFASLEDLKIHEKELKIRFESLKKSYPILQGMVNKLKYIVNLDSKVSIIPIIYVLYLTNGRTSLFDKFISLYRESSLEGSAIVVSFDDYIQNFEKHVAAIIQIEQQFSDVKNEVMDMHQGKIPMESQKNISNIGEKKVERASFESILSVLDVYELPPIYEKYTDQDIHKIKQINEVFVRKIKYLGKEIATYSKGNSLTQQIFVEKYTKQLHILKKSYRAFRKSVYEGTLGNYVPLDSLFVSSYNFSPHEEIISPLSEGILVVDPEQKKVDIEKKEIDKGGEQSNGLGEETKGLAQQIAKIQQIKESTQGKIEALKVKKLEEEAEQKKQQELLAQKEKEIQEAKAKEEFYAKEKEAALVIAQKKLILRSKKKLAQENIKQAEQKRLKAEKVKQQAEVAARKAKEAQIIAEKEKQEQAKIIHEKQKELEEQKKLLKEQQEKEAAEKALKAEQEKIRQAEKEKRDNKKQEALDTGRLTPELVSHYLPQLLVQPQKICNIIPLISDIGLRKQALQKIFEGDQLGFQETFGLRYGSMFPKNKAKSILDNDVIENIQQRIELDSRNYLSFEQVQQHPRIPQDVKDVCVKIKNKEILHGGMNYIVISKTTGKAYLFNAKHYLVGKQKVLLGRNLGDEANTSSVHTTPAGEYRVWEKQNEYTITDYRLKKLKGYAKPFYIALAPKEDQYDPNFKDGAATRTLGLHASANPKVRELLYSNSLAGRRVSDGCINFASAFFGEVYDHVEVGSLIYVTDEP